ncbi:MAG: hypothetical protein H0U87_04400 [Acidobacteria bacterium]|jgi:hypothetical protein|nr:hypothetical protein [Acidobacteriota bacterium]
MPVACRSKKGFRQCPLAHGNFSGLHRKSRAEIDNFSSSMVKIVALRTKKVRKFAPLHNLPIFFIACRLADLSLPA